MNVACIYDGSSVNIIEVNILQQSGYIEVVYINSSGVMRRDRLPYTFNTTIATAVTAIGGVAV